jgi:prepilin-type N-terminal cleavage/methylation domain-containing protein
MRARSSAGFTLIEGVIVVAVLGITAALGIPAMLEIMWRNKVQLATRETIVQMQEARFRSIREGEPFGVFADFANNRLVTFHHVDVANPADPTDPANSEQLRFFDLPGGIVFQGPADADPNGAGAIEGFAESASPGVGGWVTFRPDGSAVMLSESTTAGGFRVAMPERSFFYEASVAPAATGRIRVLVWDGTEFSEP